MALHFCSKNHQNRLTKEKFNDLIRRLIILIFIFVYWFSCDGWSAISIDTSIFAIMTLHHNYSKHFCSQSYLQRINPWTKLRVYCHRDRTPQTESGFFKTKSYYLLLRVQYRWTFRIKRISLRQTIAGFHPPFFPNHRIFRSNFCICVHTNYCYRKQLPLRSDLIATVLDRLISKQDIRIFIFRKNDCNMISYKKKLRYLYPQIYKRLFICLRYTLHIHIHYIYS